MEWATKLNTTGTCTLIDSKNQSKDIPLSDLVKVGVPSLVTSHQLTFEGHISNWQLSSADQYLQSFGFSISSGLENRHQVVTFEDHAGLKIHVPALVLMRAFYKPHMYLFDRIFEPGNIDLISFVDYTQMTPTVVIDNMSFHYRVLDKTHGLSQDRFIQWLQLSKSARQMTNGIYSSFKRGELSLLAPCGFFNIKLRGLLDNDNLYVTWANLLFVTISAQDSLTGKDIDIAFHQSLDPQYQPWASVTNFEYSFLKSTQYHPLTDDEWLMVSHLVAPRRNRIFKYVVRELLDAIIFKLMTDTPWRQIHVTSFKHTNLCESFRRWTKSGQLAQVLQKLDESRN